MQKTVYQDRILRFLGTFAGEANSQGRVDFVEHLLHKLVDLCYVKDHSARWRACQLVHCLMSSLPGDAAVSDDVADAIQSAMLERLDDAKPNIRAAAVRALARLPMPDEVKNTIHIYSLFSQWDLHSDTKHWNMYHCAGW